MTNPIEAWRTEHAYFSRLLALLRRELDAFHNGERPNYELMLDIIGYLREYSDELHHPREDVAFARMQPRCPELKLVLARLEQEHRAIARAGEALRKELEAALDGAVLPRDEIEMAAATYLVYYGNHIAKEDEDVLPRAGEVLEPADWAAVRDAVPPRHDPVFGKGGDGSAEHFRELRRHIALEA